MQICTFEYTHLRTILIVLQVTNGLSHGRYQRGRLNFAIKKVYKTKFTEYVGPTLGQAGSLHTLRIAGPFHFRCEFVLRMKGVDFVLRLRDAHPNLNRPSIRNAVSLDVPPTEIRRTPRNPPAERINMTQLENMGFTRGQIERAISRYYEGSQNHNEDHSKINNEHLTPASLAIHRIVDLVKKRKAYLPNHYDLRSNVLACVRLINSAT